jgi:hypothetical protein
MTRSLCQNKRNFMDKSMVGFDGLSHKWVAIYTAIA